MTRFATFVPILLLAAGYAVTANAQTKITIMEPEAGKELAGKITVKAKADGGVPKNAFVGLDGANWQPMKLDEETGIWTGEIDSTLVPNGDQKLMVLTDNKKVKAISNFTIDNPLKVFFADLHSHTGYSDGTLTPAMAHKYARNTAELDVFCLTDHLEHVDDTEWLDTREVAWKANEDGTFVSFPGLEWTKKWGHMNIYDPKQRVWPNDPQEFYKAAAEADVTTKFNHPGDGSKSHDGLAYSEIGDQTVQLMEVRQVTEEKAFIRALDKGWHIAPEGSDDTHSPNWGKCGRWTGIYAPGLSKQNILDALANRRCYSTLDRNCRLIYRINDARPGDIVSEPVQDIELYVRVDDPDESDVITKIELIEDGKVILTDEPNKQGHCWETRLTPEPGKHYYFIKVTQADGDLLWCAPIWLSVAG